MDGDGNMPLKTKEERIKELAATLDPILEAQETGPWEIETYNLAAQLINAGFGNLRAFKVLLIETYLREGAIGILKLMQEDI